MKSQLLSAVVNKIPVTLSTGNNSVKVKNGVVTASTAGKSAITEVPDVVEAMLVADQLPMVFEALRGQRSLPRGWGMAA